MNKRQKVVKGLMCDTEHFIGYGCNNCPYGGLDGLECTSELSYEALAVINEYEEELQRAKKALRTLQDEKDDIVELLKCPEIKPFVDIDEAKCPICKVKLTRQELIGENVLYEDFFDYCPHCGRKVKWQ